MKKISLVMLFIATLISCTKNTTPEGVLKEFVSKRFSESFDSSDFSEYLAGELLDEVLADNGKYLDKINASKNFKMGKFKINTKRCIEDKCFLTYSLGYDAPYETQEAKSKSSMVSVSVRKIAEMKKFDGMWKIFSITDVKTNFEYQE